MAKKISDLVGDTALDGTELLAVTRGDGSTATPYETRSATAQQVADLASSGTASSVDVSTDYTFLASDVGKIVYVDISGNTGNMFLTIDTPEGTAYDAGAIINVVLTADDGTTTPNQLVIQGATVTGETTVTVNGTAGGSVNVTPAGSAVSLHQKSSGVWWVVGAVS